MVKLNIGVLQLNPRIGKIRSNIEQANSILSKYGYNIPFFSLHNPSSDSLSPKNINKLSEISSCGNSNELDSNSANHMCNSSINSSSDNISNHIRPQIPLDILVLPELAFTGYNFQSSKEINPFLEPTSAGISTNWAKHVSKALGCHVLVGYPEKFIHDKKIAEKPSKNDIEYDGHSSSENYTIYNSAVMVSPPGNVVFNYRKSFLYSSDEQWGCSESPDMKDGPDATKVFPLTGTIMVRNRYSNKTQQRTKFFKELDTKPNQYQNNETHVTLPNSVHTTITHQKETDLVPLKVQVGICMDLNPYKFQAPFEKYEFAKAAVRNDVSLVLCPMAWLHTDSPDLLKRETFEAQKSEALSSPFSKIFGTSVKSYEQVLQDRLASIQKELNQESDKPNKSTYMYWYHRMMPMLVEGRKNLTGFVPCNRSGVEGLTAYAGSSSIFQFDKANKKVIWHGSLGQGSEDLMIKQIEVDP